MNKTLAPSSKHFLAAAATMAGGHAAYAEIIHFVNPDPGQPGHYNWHLETPLGGFWQSWLDITVGPDQQTNTANGNSVGQLFSWPPAGSYIFNHTGWGTSASVLGLMGSGSGCCGTVGLTLGDPVQSGMTPYGQVEFGYGIVHSELGFPLGDRRYLGLRTVSGNYGWIAVERNVINTPFGPWGMNFTAFAWAYETEPGVPIYAGQIPSPGTLALLAFGAILAPSRTRKSS